MTQKKSILARLTKGTPPEPKVGKLCFGVRRPLAPDTFKTLVARAHVLSQEVETKMKGAVLTVYNYTNPSISDFRSNVRYNEDALSHITEALELLEDACNIGTPEERESTREKISTLKNQEEECRTEISDAQRVIDREDSFDDYFFCDKRRAHSQLHADNFSCDDY